MVLLAQPYYLRLQTQSHHSHQAPKLNVDSRGLVFEHVISSVDQWAEYLKGVPPCEKRVVLQGHLKQYLHGIHARMLSTKQEALNVDPGMKTPNEAFSAPHF